MNENETEWVDCDANFTQNNDRILLNFPSGSFLIGSSDVKFSENKLLLKTGANIEILENSDDTMKLSGPRNCSNRIPATNREERIPKYGCETKCFGVVMVCYYCVYDAGGVLRGEESKICGVCVGIPF